MRWYTCFQILTETRYLTKNQNLLCCFCNENWLEGHKKCESLLLRLLCIRYLYGTIRCDSSGPLPESAFFFDLWKWILNEVRHSYANVLSIVSRYSCSVILLKYQIDSWRGPYDCWCSDIKITHKNKRSGIK